MMSLATQKMSQIRWQTALFSLVLSTLAFYSDDIINRDGILYIGMAETYLQQGLAATAQYSDLYWPFYAILIAHLHSITSVPLEFSASILNTIFFVVLTDALVLLSSRLVANSRQLTIAALLFLCLPTLNDYRDFIIRDAGYWAFCSLALYQFILFVEKPSLGKAVIWQVTATLAILFRIEGLVTLLALPLYLVFTLPLKQALKQAGQLYFLFIFAAITTLFFSMSQTGFLTAFGKISSLIKYIHPDSFLSAFNAKSAIIASDVLPVFSADYSGLILASGLITMLTYKMIKALSLGYIVLYFIPWQKNIPRPNTPYFTLITYFVSLNLTVLLVFLFHGYFITTRYAVVAVLGLLLLMLPTICSNIETLWLNKKRALVLVVALILFISLVAGMTQSNSKSYIRKTAQWSAEHIPQGSHILVNSKELQYYFAKYHGLANIEVSSDFSAPEKYDYMLTVEGRRNTQLKATLAPLSLETIYSRKNKRGDQAVLYQVLP